MISLADCIGYVSLHRYMLSIHQLWGTVSNKLEANYYILMRDSLFHFSAKRFPVSTNFDGSLARIVNWGWQQPAGGLFSTINDLNQVNNNGITLKSHNSIHFLTILMTSEIYARKFEICRCL